MQIILKQIEDLKPYDKNPRKNDGAVEYVANSIKEFGFKVPVIIDKNNVIVAGHTRYKAAKKLGINDLPCIVADDLTEEQIKAFRLADNKAAEKAEWDYELLDEEIAELTDFDFEDFGFEFDYEIETEEPEEKHNERERTYNAYNMQYFDESATEGIYEIPTLLPTNYIPKRLIGFNYAKTSTDYEACVHFYLDDYQFERVWNQPERYYPILRKFEAVMTPNFSVYYDMAKAVKIWNTYRSRLLGQMLQRAGLEVIPIVYWGDERTWDYCFDGLPENGVLSINTIGNNMEDSWAMWHTGVDELIKRKSPTTLT